MSVITTTYSQFRNKMMSFFREIKSTKEPLIITSSEGEFVVLSREDFESLETTNYLLKTPANTLHLAEAKKLYESGKGEIIKDEGDIKKYVEDL